jgi:hypothetical protein
MSKEIQLKQSNFLFCLHKNTDSGKYKEDDCRNSSSDYSGQLLGIRYETKRMMK